MLNPVSNNKNVSFTGGVNPKLAKFITRMTKADALEAIIALEATVVTGRTIQAYKRGKWDEARERFLEEITGSIVWLWGVKVLNSLGDNLLGRVLKKKDVSFDVGTDKVLRRPFDNFMNKVAPKGFSSNSVALLKGAKVLSSILIANLFIGFMVPKVNHFITNTIRHKKRLEEEAKAEAMQQREEAENNSSDTENIAFKGSGLAALNSFTNMIENTNTGKLLSTDLGIAGGRMYNARTKEERREIAFRDLGSIYFYMWAQGHVGNIMNYLESGRFTRLNPESAATLNEYLEKMLKNKGGSLSVEDFRKAALGKNISEIELPKGVKFEKAELSAFSKFFNRFRSKPAEPLEVVKVSELEKIITDSSLLDRIKGMSKLQPERLGEAVVTKQQLLDACNTAEVNNPKLLDKVFKDFSKGSSAEEFKYISNSKLYKIKAQMEAYIADICKMAKDGKIDKSVLEDMKKKNLKLSGINYAAGFLFAAAFLSTIIPKLQYLMTKKTTGVDAFPGTYDYEHHKVMDA